jgi:hypothetical protein
MDEKTGVPEKLFDQATKGKSNLIDPVFAQKAE